MADEGGGGSEGHPELRGTIVVGTYDGALLGLSLESGEQTFGYAPHVGCVKTIHCNKAGSLASGGTDNAVRLFDLAKGLENGELQVHEDTVSCVRLWESSTLVSGDKTGTVCIWQAGNWEVLHKFRAHKEGVASLAVHPSGRVMASSGRDRGLRLWDLMRGTCAASLDVEEAAEELEWSPDGSRIAALSPRGLQLVNATTGEVLAYRDPSCSGLTRVSLTAVMFLSGGPLLLGDGRGDVRVLEPDTSGKSLVEVSKLPSDAKRGRIKALLRGGADAADGLFVVGTSTGRVEVWMTRAGARVSEDGAFAKLWDVDTDLRLTCAALWFPGPGNMQAAVSDHKAGVRRKKRRRKAEA
mmetsp:Transcript_10241/g.30814  ORF Transcript_10241/g.30814 Transcript_10241/m.30814 type:complete len:354 (-) Transcript_10241:215-1276(-)